MLILLRAIVGVSLVGLLLVFLFLPDFSGWIDENPWMALFGMVPIIVIVTRLFPKGEDLNEWVYRDDT